MKHVIIATAAMLLLAAAVSAAENPVDKGSMIVAGNAYFMSQSGDAFENADEEGVTWFGIAPSVGYFVAPGFLIGAMVDFSTASQGDTKLTDMMIGPMIGYYFNMDKTRTEARGAVYPFVRGFFTYGSEKYESDSSELTTGITQFGGEAGVVFMVSNAVGLNFGGMVSSTSFNPDDDVFPDAESVSGMTFQIGAGITAFIY